MAEFGGLDTELRPVMTLRVAGEWIAVRVDRMESVALAPRLWPVPFSRREYAGLHDAGDQLVPVLTLGPDAGPNHDALLAILHVRGESVGLVIDRAGRVHERYWLDEPTGAGDVPDILAELGATRARTREQSFWLIDPDKLWQPILAPSGKRAEAHAVPATHRRR
jgi:chemotaxis signal transduction protein